MRTRVGLLIGLLALGASAALALRFRNPLLRERAAEAAEPPEPAALPPGANRLALEASPYLQLHAHNPVDWYPWGEEAFARARAESKPVFLSVGYSTCYWCHVMEREVFSDPEIAAYLNAHFIPIKVDREERPDVDELYMSATQMLSGGGGWPNSVFLTPEAKPFYAGTYFPRVDRPGRPGFPRVLRAIADAWRDERPRILETAGTVARAIAERPDTSPAVALASLEPAEVLARAQSQLLASYDPEHGGFGRGTKFPRPPSLALLLSAAGRPGESQALAALRHTLDKMALGGIHDHLGGGFHRYATEPTWSVPHFEKMLYDNAQLLGLYARAYARTSRPLYRWVAADIAAYLERDLMHPEGGLYSAQDAEVNGVEGASYVWTRAEVESVLGAERAARFFSIYELAPLPEGSAGVLRVRRSLRLDAEDGVELLERLASERAKLLAARARRPQALTDHKVLAAWNGLAIRGLVDAARFLDESRYAHLAERVASFVLERLRAPDGELRRSYVAGQLREAAVLDDYAFVIDGLLALHEHGGDPHWLAEARALADRMLARFEDPTGGFFLTLKDPTLLARPKPLEDGVEPSGNGVAARSLRELAARTGDPRYRAAADRTREAHAELLSRAPATVPTLVAALAQAPGATAARPSRAGRAAPEPRSRLPSSADHVRVSLRRAPGSGARIIVELAIDPGWHVNANPASLPYLVATSVALEGARSGRVEYPPGRDFRPAFSSDALLVYDGRVSIPVSLEEASPELSVAVRFQACDERRCLPPSVSRATLPRG